MKPLHAKLWRDAWQLRGPALAIALVVMSGIATLVMAMSNHQALQDSRARFYDSHHFADVFAPLKRAPLALLPQVRALPGVAQVQARVVAAVNLEPAGFEGAVTAQVVSLPEVGEDGLNRVYLRAGRLPELPHEAVLSEAFAQAHQLRPGDGLVAIVNGRRQNLLISGIGLSPEHVYQIRPGDLFPDFERFAILWMPRATLARAFDLDGAFNHLALRLHPRARSADVVDALDALLRPYGGSGAHDRSLQLSHRFLDEELKQLQTMSWMFSTIFLGVAAFLLHIVITRLIGTQREQIALLKAFGYGRWTIARHYASQVGVLVALGVLPGIALGAWMGLGMASLYQDFFRFPELHWRLAPGLVLLAAAFALTSAALGTAAGLRRAFALPPAEAMRPESPPVFRPSLLERLGPSRWLDAAALMVLRQIRRRPLRALLSVVGMGLAGGILVMSHLQSAAIDELLAVQFGLSQREDLAVTLAEPVDLRALHEIQSLPGVLAAEPVRSSAVRLRHGHRSEITSLQGLEPEGQLRRVLDAQRRPVTVPGQGLLLTDHLAQQLGLRVGDVLQVEFLDGRRETLWMPLAATVTEYLGVGAYAQRGWINRLRQEGDVLTGAWLQVAPEAQAQVLGALRERPRVAAVSDRMASIRSFRETMAQNILTFTLVATLMAASIAAGVVYNAARITLAERARDLASLRILGYTRGEVRGLLLGELATLTLAALLPAFAFGWALSALLLHGMQSDLYRIPLVLPPPTFAFAGTVLLVAAGASAWLVLRRLDRLDLVAVLKTRE